jgi:hypothetical protein
MNWSSVTCHSITSSALISGDLGNLRISVLFLLILKVAPKTLLVEGWNKGDVYDHKTARPR